MRFTARLFSAAVLIGLGALAPLPAASKCCSVVHGDTERGELPDQTRVRFELPDGGRLLPGRLVLIGASGPALVAALPEWATPVSETRAPVGRIPVLGQAFEERPYLDKIETQQPVGAVHRLGDDLAVRFGPDFGQVAPPAGATVALLMREPRTRRTASLTLEGLRFETAPATDALGERIGSAYLVDDRLVLAPPLESLRGFNLF